MNRLDRRRKTLAVALAALAGYTDAVGFLAADRYFVSFMSGNTTRLAVDLVTDSAAAALPAILLGGFVAGAALGAFVAVRAAIWRKPAVIATAGALLAAAALAGPGSRIAELVLLVLAMGTLNSTFRRDDGASLGLTYMTGALVRTGQALGEVIGGGKWPVGAGDYLALWSGLLGGAITGAAMAVRHGEVALLLATAAALVMALAAWRIVRRELLTPP